MYKLLTGLLCLFLSTVSFAQDDGKDKITTTYYSTDHAAIKGYDPVAYFTEGKAIKGDQQFVCNWSNSNWYFVSAAHLDSFKVSPDKYAPQFGGYCAYGTSENHKSPTDPTAFTIVNDKLYLNYNNQVKTMWLKDTANRIEKANQFWPALNQTN